MNPLVSVVCLCYNHKSFVRQAVQSVISQTYNSLQIIIVDDASTDGSQLELEKLSKEFQQVELLLLPNNVGNCKAFNTALKKVKGDFVIDFATDDLMLPERIEKQVSKFASIDNSYGVVFTNAEYIDSSGHLFRNHTRHLFKRKLISKTPEGWIFQDLIGKYFVCGPTMLVRKEVFDKLNGYDEDLAYEDFDFWIRSSREFKYAYLDEVLTKVRRVGGSLSSKQYQSGDQQLHSTFLVCKKALNLCRDENERNVLLHRARYEFRQAIFSGNRKEAKLFAQLETEIAAHGWQYYFFTFLSWLPFPWPWLRRQYHHLFYS